MDFKYYLYRALFKPYNVVIPRFWKVYNYLIFRVGGVKMGANFCVHNHVYLSRGKNSEITIGDNFVFSSSACINPLSRNIKGCIVTNPNTKLIIGNGVGISSASIWVHEQITIHDNVNIGADCIIMDSDAHSLNYLHRRRYPKETGDDWKNKINRPIEIGEDCLIGTRSIILKGVHIGARTVIGAGSVVTKDIPSDCIAAGNPCRVIKKLKNETNPI